VESSGNCFQQFRLDQGKFWELLSTVQIRSREVLGTALNSSDYIRKSSWNCSQQFRLDQGKFWELLSTVQIRSGEVLGTALNSSD